MEGFTLAEYKEELCNMGGEIKGNEKLVQFMFKTAYLVKAFQLLGWSDDVKIAFSSEEN